MKFKVKCDCYGFQGKYWVKDEITDDIADADAKNIPGHFEPLEKNKEVKKVSDHKANAKKE